MYHPFEQTKQDIAGALYLSKKVTSGKDGKIAVELVFPAAEVNADEKR